MNKLSVMFFLVLINFIVNPSLTMAAPVSGTITKVDKTITLTDGFAFRIMYPLFDETNPVTIVLFSEMPINKKALSTALQGATKDQLSDILRDKLDEVFVRLIIYDTKAHLDMHLPSQNYSFSGMAQTDLKDNSTQHTQGSYSLNNTDMDNQPLKIDLQWDIDITDVKTK